MSDSLAFHPAHLPDHAAAKTAPRIGFGARLMAILEKLVAAQTRQTVDGAPLLYRFPPI